MKNIDSKVTLWGILRRFAAQNTSLFDGKRVERAEKFKTRAEDDSDDSVISRRYQFEFEKNEDSMNVEVAKEIFLKGPLQLRPPYRNPVRISYGQDTWNRNGSFLRFDLFSDLRMGVPRESGLCVPLVSVCYVSHKRLGLMRCVETYGVDWGHGNGLDSVGNDCALNFFIETQRLVASWIEDMMDLENDFP